MFSVATPKPFFVPDVSACFVTRSLASFSSPSRRFAPHRSGPSIRRPGLAVSSQPEERHRGSPRRFPFLAGGLRRPRARGGPRRVRFPAGSEDGDAELGEHRRRAKRLVRGVLGVVVETSPARIERCRRGRRGSRRRRFSHHARLFRRRGVRGVLRLSVLASAADFTPSFDLAPTP